jgi:hypothetical protein
VTVDGQIEGLSAGAAGVWISLCAPAEAAPCSWQVADVDPGTGTIVQTIPVGDWKSDPDPGSEGSVGRVDVAMDGAQVWASIAINYSGWAKGKIVEIDPAAGAVVRTVPVDGGNGTDNIEHTSDIYGPPVIQGGVIWIINIENDEVVRLDLEPKP